MCEVFDCVISFHYREAINEDEITTAPVKYIDREYWYCTEEEAYGEVTNVVK